MTFIDKVEQQATGDRNWASLFLFLLLAWSVVTVVWAVPTMQDDLGTRSEAALADQFPNESVEAVNFSGRSGTIVAAKGASEQQMLATIASLNGVRNVAFEAQPATPAAKSKSKPANSVAAVSSRTVEIQPAPTPAARATAQTSVATSPQIKQSNRVEIESAPIQVASAAIIDSQPATAMAADSVDTADVRLLWDGETLQIRGSVPNEKQANQLQNLAGTLFAQYQVDTHALSVNPASASLPQENLASWLRSLRNLRDGTVQLTPDLPTIQGRAGDEAAFGIARERLMLRGIPEQSFSRIALAPFEQPYIAVQGNAAKVLVSGSVQNMHELSSLSNAFLSVFGRDRLINQLQINRNVAPGSRHIELLHIVSRVQQIPSFVVEFKGQSASVNGLVDSVLESDFVFASLDGHTLLGEDQPEIQLAVMARDPDQVVAEILAAQTGQPFFIPYNFELAVGGYRAVDRAAEMMESYPGYQLIVAVNLPPQMPLDDARALGDARVERLTDAMYNIGIPMKRIEIHRTETVHQGQAVQFAIIGAS